MRIRSTKPEFWRSERIASVSWDARLVLKGLESYVDDNGVGKDDLALIVGDLFQRDLVRDPLRTLERVRAAISELNEAGLLWRYEDDGTDLLYVAWWEDIQRVDKPQAGRFRRPDGTMNYKDSRILASPREPSRGVPKSTEAISRPSEGGARALDGELSTGGAVPVENREHSGIAAGHSDIRESVANPREDSRTLAPGTGEQGNRGTGTSSSATAPPRADVERLCDLLADLIEANGSKRPTVTQKWRDDARLMLDRDERPRDEAERLIRWCQSDTFWRGNVLSMPTFRKQYDKLRLKAQENGQHLRAVPAVPGEWWR